MDSHSKHEIKDAGAQSSVDDVRTGDTLQLSISNCVDDGGTTFR